MIFINIGSNLNSQDGDRIFNIKKAIDLICSEKIKIVKKSSLYETPSYPNKKNPKFLNICLQNKDQSQIGIIIGYSFVQYDFQLGGQDNAITT